MREELIDVGTRIPVNGPWPRLEALGFVPGFTTDDELFRDAIAPIGWRREGPDERGVTFLVDPRGFRCVGIVDRVVDDSRSVFFEMCNVGWDLADRLSNHEGEPLLPPQWDTLSAEERSEFRRGASHLSRELFEKSRRARRLLQLAEDREFSDGLVRREEAAGARHDDDKRSDPTNDATHDMAIAMGALMRLDDAQRRRILCWFCERCARYIGPGMPSCSCPE